MTADITHQKPSVSIAIFAWNEERAIAACLESLRQQTVFAELARRGQAAEIVCVLNGCTDSTARVAEEHLSKFLDFPESQVDWRVISLPERGKLNAWNKYVHELSAPGSAFMVLMDADIVIHEPRTVWNMVNALENAPMAAISVDRPRKHLEFKPRRTPADAFSIRASTLTRSAEAQLCAQLYCIRAEVARRIYLPRDLAACEDGFIKALVCTDFLAGPVNPRRIVQAENAEHVFEAYTSPQALLKNQKRQVMGQTMVHLLIDVDLPRLSSTEKRELAAILRTRDQTDPKWLKRLLSEHLSKSPHFWRVCPSYVGTPYRRWVRLPWLQRIARLPAMTGGTLLGLFGSFLAHRALKAGCTDYWPRAERAGAPPVVGASLALPAEAAKR